jgi:glucose/arabinose dehydrogenase
MPRVRLVPVASVEQPLALAVRPSDPSLYVAEKTGRVVAIRDGVVDPTPVLDLSDEVSLGAEQGLLGLAFSPDGSFLYVDFTDLHGDTHVEEFTMLGDRADVATRRRVLFVRQPFSNHNGGNLVFGPDDMLYVGLGDGGSGGDPLGNGQSLSTLLGKILRIDPRAGRPYAIPPDNPFLGRPDVRPEIWALGLRNPWRFSFDGRNGDLWIGDVGQSSWEEIDVQPAGSAGGLDFGWNLMEGDHPYAGASPTTDLVPPIYEYSHAAGACAVTGGYVYRGRSIPALTGAYVFGDFCLGRLEALRVGPGGTVQHWLLGPVLPNLASFGEDDRGELYALSLTDGVFRLAPP